MPRKSKHVHIIGVPLDHGAGRRGVGMGPAALRIAKLGQALTRNGYTFSDHGDLDIPAPETRSPGEESAKHLPVVAAACEELCTVVRNVLEQKAFPLVVGGDHSIAIGTIAGLADYLRFKNNSARAYERLGVIWFDAHADINTPETSPSGNIHGMPVACLLGHGPQRLTNIPFAGPKILPRKLVQIGLRDIDEHEKRLVRDFGITPFTMADIDKRGMAAVIEEAISIASEDSDLLHVSFDIDAVDPRVAPGTGTPKLGGLTYREAHLALEMIAETGLMTSMEMVEINPILDKKNATAEVAVGLIASAMGKRIL